MGHACGDLTEGGQLLSHDNLVLRLLEIGQHYFQFLVLTFKLSILAVQFRQDRFQFGVFLFELGGLVPQLVVQFLHQVEANGFQGVLTKYFQGRRHFRQFVVAFHDYLFFQLPFGHFAHTAGKHIDAVQDHPAHKQPTDQQCAADADDADGQQQGEAGGDGPGGRLRGFLGGQRGDSHQFVHFHQQVGGLLPAEGQEGALLFGQLQFRTQGYENAVFGQPQLFQPGIQWRQALLQFGVVQRGHIAVYAGDGRLETLLLGLHQGRVENAEYTGKLLEGDVGIGLQGREMTVGAELLLREVGGVRSNESA